MLCIMLQKLSISEKCYNFELWFCFRIKLYINRLSKTIVFMSENLLNTFKPEMTYTV